MKTSNKILIGYGVIWLFGFVTLLIMVTIVLY
jgi:hypothetical protein